MALTITDAGITVSISRELSAPTQKGFGIMAFLTDGVTTQVREYTSLAALSGDYAAGTEAYKAGSAFFSQSPTPERMKVAETDLTDLTVALDAVLAVDKDFYFVAVEQSVRASLTSMDAIAAWTEANDRFFVGVTNTAADIEAATVGAGLFGQMKTKGYARTMSIYSSIPDEYPDVSAIARHSTVNYASTDSVMTLKFKDLPGISTEDISTTQLETIRDNNGNVLVDIRGVRMFDAGRTAGSGFTWIDDVVGTDALTEQILVNVYGIMTRVSTKIPMTEAGMAVLKSETVSAMAQFVRNGFLSERIKEDEVLPAFLVTSEPMYLHPAASKAARIAPVINIIGRVASAIHEVNIEGRLVFEF